jgi:hypothetical protein
MRTIEREKGGQRRGDPFTFWLTLLLIMTPMLYVLLSGPAVWLFQHGYLRNVLPWIYKPMIWLEQSDTSLGRLLAWYWSLWK